MLRILGRVTSINARKVLWAADEMGIAYEHEIWGKPDRDPNVADFLALNPNGQVPVIIDDGFVLWESSAILGISQATAQFHLKNAIGKLGVASKQQAVLRALELYLID